MKKLEINIEGMSCNNCVKRVENVLKKKDNVVEVSVNLKGADIVIEDNNYEDIKNSIEDLGYVVTSINEK